jgi:hypothetical protein
VRLADVLGHRGAPDAASHDLVVESAEALNPNLVSSEHDPVVVVHVCLLDPLSNAS